MRIELMTGLSNIVRFPVERCARPSLALLNDIAPDVREVLSVAEAFGLDPLRDDFVDVVDAQFAEEILDTVPMEPGPVRTRLLDEMLERVTVQAVEACGIAHDASLIAGAAQHRWMATLSQEGHANALELEADKRMRETAAAFLEAHVRVQSARGAARAIRLARTGEMWTRRSTAADMDWLCDVHLKGASSSSRGA